MTWTLEQTDVHFVGASTGCLWRDLDPADLARRLACSHPYNIRPARVGDELVILGSLAVLGEDPARRRAWLVEQVECVARRMEPRASAATRSARAVSSSPGALAALRNVAAARAWSVRGEAALEIDPGDDAGVVLRASPADDGIAIRADATPPLQLAPAPHDAAVLAIAALGLNARFGAARLRLVDAERSHFVAELLLPDADPSEDELEFALEGVRHAADEARRTLGCLVHPAVAHAYAAALELSLG